MEKLKIAVIQTGKGATGDDLVRQICGDATMLELCTPQLCDTAESAGDADALVYATAGEPVECPTDATEVIATAGAVFLPLAREPQTEDIARFAAILERDFDLRSPRIAIVQDTGAQKPDLASQATAGLGINTYGPYTSEQLAENDKACHFDGIITAGGAKAALRIVAELAMGVPVRYFAGRETVATAACQAPETDTAEEGLADISALTHPFYTAIDIIRARAAYDEARQNPLPKLYRDKREDRKKDAPAQATPSNDNTEKTS